MALVLTHPRSLHGRHADNLDSKELSNTNFHDNRSVGVGVLISVIERAGVQKKQDSEERLYGWKPKSADCSISPYLTKWS